MTKREDVYGYVNETARRAESEPYGDPVRPAMADIDLPAPSLVDPYIEKAERFAFMGRQLPEGTRFRRVKELILRVTQLITEDQIEFNQTVLGALKVANVDAYGRLAGIQMLVASVELAIQEALDELERSRELLLDARGRAPAIRVPPDDGTSLARVLPVASPDFLDDVVADLVGAVQTRGSVLIISGGDGLGPLLEGEGYGPIAGSSDLTSLDSASLVAAIILDCIEVFSDRELESVFTDLHRALIPTGALIVRGLDPENLLTLSRLSLMSSSARAVHPSRLAETLSSCGFVDSTVRPTDSELTSSGLTRPLPGDDVELARLIDLVERKMFGPRRYVLKATTPGPG